MLPNSLISIYGDSISTLQGYSPDEGVFYDPAYPGSSRISSVSDTWWGKVISGACGQLLVNNSYAGSTVSMGGYQAACAPWRIEKLKRGGAMPDCILVFSGLNDVATYRPPEDFGRHYRAMLSAMEEIYPDAEVWCGTLCRGFVTNPNLALFVDLNRCLPLADYNAAIREAVAGAPNARLADLAAFGASYASMDGVHPNATGMETLAQLWLRSLLEQG